MKTPLFPKLAASVFITLIALFTGPSIAQAKRDIEGQVFIVTKGGENVKLGLVPIWVIGESEMKALAKQAVELADAAALKKKLVEENKKLQELEDKAVKELTESGAKKVKAAANEERQAMVKKFEPFSTAAERGMKLIEKVDKQKRGLDFGEIASMAMLGSEFATKILIGLMAEKESDVESDADGRFKVSVDNGPGWAIAYGQRTLGKIGQTDIQNSEQYYWVVELPQKKSQLFLSSNNCDLSEAEVRLRSLAFEGERGGIFGAFKGPAKATSGPVANTGNTQKVYDEEKKEQDRIKAEKERIAAEEKREQDRIRAEKERIAAAERAEKERLAAAERAERERLAAVERAEKERLAAAEVKERQSKAVTEGVNDKDGRLLVSIPGGAFEMGSSEHKNARVHSVNVTAFFLGQTEVTYGEWKSVSAWANAKGYDFNGDRDGTSDKHPVTGVSWYDVVKWCNAKSELEGLKPCYQVRGKIYRGEKVENIACDWNANGYRLPTEAEWERAARGGLAGKPFPNGDELIKGDANFDGTGTVEVGKYAANGYGLYDMAGNVYEWCWDWAGPYGLGVDDPRGSETGVTRVFRGGSWFDGTADCRSARRSINSPDYRSNRIGFRVARGSIETRQGVAVGERIEQPVRGTSGGGARRGKERVTNGSN